MDNMDDKNINSDLGEIFNKLGVSEAELGPMAIRIRDQLICIGLAQLAMEIIDKLETAIMLSEEVVERNLDVPNGVLEMVTGMHAVMDEVERRAQARSKTQGQP